jgi:hypothetical protein
VRAIKGRILFLFLIELGFSFTNPIYRLSLLFLVKVSQDHLFTSIGALRIHNTNYNLKISTFHIHLILIFPRHLLPRNI